MGDWWGCCLRFAEGGERDNFDFVGMDDGEGGAEDIVQVVGVAGTLWVAGGSHRDAAPDVRLNRKRLAVAVKEGHAVPDEFFAYAEGSLFFRRCEVLVVVGLNSDKFFEESNTLGWLRVEC